ncbi:hypothetical protein I4U23_031206 [Adineta vaga]|nr:hypothetical protein I4U23_031206 [Adineta vaga]
MVKCNSKIRHFLGKYAHLDPIMIEPITNNLCDQLKLKRDGLYNFLKHIRNTKDVTILGLNSNNVVSVLMHVYYEFYLDQCEEEPNQDV